SPGTVFDPAAARRSTRAQNAKDAHVVLDRRDLRFGTVADEILETFDVAVALGALAEHDSGTFGPIDMARSEKGRRDQVDADVPPGSALLELHEFTNRWITEVLIL